jgi:transcriptional regulator with XRE-family HTH domain
LEVNDMSLAEALRRLRLERYLSQTELAEKAGISRATVARIEAGEIVPYLRTVRKLAEALNVEPTALAAPAELERPRRRGLEGNAAA